MKRKMVYALTLACATLALAAGVLFWHSERAAAAGETVGFVDAERILQNYAPAVAVNEELARIKTDSEESLRVKVREKYGSADVATLPKENQLEVQQMVDEAESKFQKDVDAIRGQKWEPILAKVRESIGRVAGANGLMVVLQKDAVLFGGMDITDKVIEDMNKNAAVTPAPVAPAPASPEPEKLKTKK
jgi:outer membrane protein